MTGRPTGRQELCDCGQIFSGTYSGDMHRVGLHHVSIGPDRRRCLTVAEMLDRGNDPGFGRSVALSSLR